MGSNITSGSILGGRYEIGAQLGQGGFGTVWRATRLADGLPVAIKVLRASADASSLQRFEREARALERLNHANCLQIFEFGREDDQAFLVTEFVRGESLSEWARPGRSLDEIIDVCTQITRALDAVHRLHVVHRDLKPANISVESTPQGPAVKVLDFGLAKLAEDEGGDVTKTGEVVGTAGHMSPEQLRGRKDIGPATDLYCLGVILFELLEGRRLFEGRDALEISMKHLLEPPPSLQREVPTPLATLVARLLQKAPEDRPRSALAVLDALEPLAATKPGAAPWAQLAAVLAVLCLVAAGLTIYLGSESDDPPIRAVPTHKPVSALMKQAKPAVVPKPPSPSAKLSPGCATERESGIQVIEYDLGGLRRRKISTRLPEPYDPNRRHPAIVLLHEGGQTPEGIIEEAGLNEIADREGIVMFAPDAKLDSFSERWNSDATEEVVDLALHAHRTLCIDRERVYLLGHGAGGLVVADLALDGIFAAAVVSSARPFGHDAKFARNRPKPAPLLLLSPTEDCRDPVEGGIGLDAWGKACATTARITLDEHETVLRAGRQGCEEREVSAKHPDGVCYSWTCKPALVSCHIEGPRHWPGYSPGGGWPAAVTDFPYQDVVWSFFDSYPAAPAAR